MELHSKGHMGRSALRGAQWGLFGSCELFADASEVAWNHSLTLSLPAADLCDQSKKQHVVMVVLHIKYKLY